MSDNGIVWEDPPEPARRNSGVWMARLTPLLEHPERWARIATYNHETTTAATAANLRRRVKGIPAGRFEFAARDRALYARYLGPDRETA